MAKRININRSRKIPTYDDKINYRLEKINSFFKCRDIEFIKETNSINGLSLHYRTKEQKKKALSSDVYFGKAFKKKDFLDLLSIIDEILTIKENKKDD